MSHVPDNVNSGSLPLADAAADTAALSIVVSSGVAQDMIQQIPKTAAERDRLSATTRRLQRQLPSKTALTKTLLQDLGQQCVDQAGLQACHLGYAMVQLGNFHWNDALLAVPFERRLLLLPEAPSHCHAGGDNGCKDSPTVSRVDRESEDCGACQLQQIQQRAEQLGYQVYSQQSSPTLMKALLANQIDGIVGLANLQLLEKAIDKVLQAGLPACAIPLVEVSSDEIWFDDERLDQVLAVYRPRQMSTSEAVGGGYLNDIRQAQALFEPDEFARLLPVHATSGTHFENGRFGETESISLDWLQNGGKRFRPFITLAAWKAIQHGRVDVETASIPDCVKQAAIAIEAFHKASLVHDDIQDEDEYRYGVQTLHRRHGVGMAINIGDYLIGLGYRLLSGCRVETDPTAVADIVQRMAVAHLQLCEGQGAEMAWTRSPSLELTVDAALEIYALKTSPAFEAALYSGLRLGGNVQAYETQITQFCRHLGIGFQVLNDLKDWRGDEGNKVVSGQDALALRPTVLLALAIAGAEDEQHETLMTMLTDPPADVSVRFDSLRELYERTGVLGQAEQIVNDCRLSAQQLIEPIEPLGLRQFLQFLIDTVLAPEEELPAEITESASLVGSSVSDQQ